MWMYAFCLVIISVGCVIFKALFSKEDSFINFQIKYFSLPVLTSLFSIICIPVFLLKPGSVYNSLNAAHYLKHISWLLGIRWELRGAENLAEQRGAVIVANHQSGFDVLGFFNFWHVMERMAAVAKKELFYVWPFGLSAYLAGTVFIDRSNPKASYDQLRITTDLMIKNKTKILIFPEGTRNKTPWNGMLPFKNGAFKMAIAAGVPVLPVVISPYYFINENTYHFGTGRIVMLSLDPVPTTGLKIEDTPMLAEKVRNMMLAAYDELSKEVNGSHYQEKSSTEQ